MKRLVYYSLLVPRSDPRPDLLDQLEWSVRSLRAYNDTVSVVVFVYGDEPAELQRVVAPHGVEIWRQGSYEERLAALAPRGWEILSRYPVLHKFLNVHVIGALRPAQVLGLDCDTFFADDVDRLFDRYAQRDCYAREEPTCRRSHYGYDPNYLDEDALQHVGAAEGVRVPAPFNLGAVLMNNRLWDRLAPLDATFINYAWRFAVWMALNPAPAAAANYAEGMGVELLRRHLDRLAPAELEAALFYPSPNRWILEEVALWFTLGHVPGFSYGDFAAEDVLQNGEFESCRRDATDWTLCHYYSQNTGRLDAWITAATAPAAQFSDRSMRHATAAPEPD